ncbi:uncharacterized protein TNCV_4280811 [Trichonephila clavipes]|nr:uncharacterized protein TNCV_4280811 [Trichonephila clavipes]
MITSVLPEFGTDKLQILAYFITEFNEVRLNRKNHNPERVKMLLPPKKLILKKADLIKLAIELCEFESDGEDIKIIELRAKILASGAYKEDPEFVKCIFESILSNRIDKKKEQKEQTLREFELQKIQLQNETQRVVGSQNLPPAKIELKKLLPTFNPEVDNMDLFLTLLERRMKLLELGEDLWVPYLIGALPSDVTSLIARAPEEKCRDCSHIRGMLLQQFKLTIEKFRELFSCNRKSPNGMCGRIIILKSKHILKVGSMSLKLIHLRA